MSIGATLSTLKKLCDETGDFKSRTALSEAIQSLESHCPTSERGSRSVEIITVQVVEVAKKRNYQPDYWKADNDLWFRWLELRVTVVEGPEYRRAINTVADLCLTYDDEASDHPRNMRRGRFETAVIPGHTLKIEFVKELGHPSTLYPKEIRSLRNMTTGENLAELLRES